ncbi:hypothetical protein BJ875DRAFT_489473 [Amylocarpus encephaloides]|uniref:Uncharacterized protein n=1 Tax=Amylocarpus encephaloides TaxID=45428 RepID=A0A9P7Y901_9HELO|nr:hypothetical protein BJ875DRAFT_489473 [Amylocarpus encephaloides]
MGTRGLLGFTIKGVRHGQYNQYDCYPVGLGQRIVNFLLALTAQEIAEIAKLLEDIEASEKALPAIKKGDLKHLIEGVTFLHDSLFSEWAYFIDLDNKTLETWQAGHHLTTASFKQLKEYEDPKAYMKDSSGSDQDEAEDGEQVTKYGGQADEVKGDTTGSQTDAAINDSSVGVMDPDKGK